MRYCGYWQLEAMRCNDVWSVYEIQISNYMSQHFITVMCCAAGVIRLCCFICVLGMGRNSPQNVILE